MSSPEGLCVANNIGLFVTGNDLRLVYLPSTLVHFVLHPPAIQISRALAI